MFFFSILSNSYYKCIENPKNGEKYGLRYTNFQQNIVPAIRGKVTYRENCTLDTLNSLDVMTQLM